MIKVDHHLLRNPIALQLSRVRGGGGRLPVPPLDPRMITSINLSPKFEYGLCLINANQDGGQNGDACMARIQAYN